MGIAVALMFIPPIIYGFALFNHPKVTIGIVIDEDTTMEHANVSLSGFELYPDYFDAEILPESFKVSKALTVNGEYLTRDIVNAGDPAALKEKYGVDVIVFLIDVPIKDHEGDAGMYGGKADTVTGSALVSVYHFYDLNEINTKKIQHVSIHEVMHLLGYMHDRWDRGGVMESPGNLMGLDINRYYRFTLPLHLYTYKAGFGSDFYIGAFVTNFVSCIMWVPYFIGVELILYASYKRSMNGRGLAFGFLLGGFTIAGFMTATMFDTASFALTPIILMVFLHHGYYTLWKIKKTPAWLFPEVKEPSHM